MRTYYHTAVLVGIFLMVAPSAAMLQGSTERNVHAPAQAWQYSGVDLPKGSVAFITAKGQWKINPLWKRAYGAGGKPGNIAPATFVKPKAVEGCLLVRSGDKIIAFARDDDTVLIDTPGKIYFCANDEPTADGAERFEELKEGKYARDYSGALPIPPCREAKGSGFLDNVGSLSVRIVVRKAQGR